MPTRSKKIKGIFTGGLGLILAAFTALSQAAPAAAPAPAAPAAPGAASVQVNPNDGTATTSALDYFFNHKPGEGTAAEETMRANKTAQQRMMAQDAMGNKRIEDPDMRSKFEAYLGMDEVPPDQLKAYAADRQQIIDLLHDKKTTQAWQQLYKLAQFQSIDAGVSWELANRIESIWNANNTSYMMAQDDILQKKKADDANYNADRMSEEMKTQDMATAAKGNAAPKPQAASPASSGTNNVTNLVVPPMGDPTQPPPSALLGKLQLTEEYLNSLQAQATIKLNDLKVQKLFDQAKDDFAKYITTLYKSKRYEHVLIAADFWRNIFDQGDYPVAMAQQVNDSLEVENQVNNTIEVFNHSVDQKNIATATDRLQEAFMASQFHPGVLGVPLSRKRPIEDFSRDLSKMQNMIEARDFTGLEPILDKFKDSAPDFDSVKAMAIVNAVKLESQLRLGKAKLAAQQGDLKGAMEEFQAAAEAWPGNPDLKDKALTFFNSEDVQTQSLTEFDRLVTENNYRGIFEKQLAFAAAMKDDTKRQDQLKDALGKVKEAEEALEKAKMMQVNGDVYGAWETVEAAVKDLPDDLKLNSMRGDLSGKAADFVSAINKAEDAEGRQDYGYSLTWYAIAQRTYPASTMANSAIDRLSKAILAKSTL